jgi:hypothetical protein
VPLWGGIRSFGLSCAPFGLILFAGLDGHGRGPLWREPTELVSRIR